MVREEIREEFSRMENVSTFGRELGMGGLN